MTTPVALTLLQQLLCHRGRNRQAEKNWTRDQSSSLLKKIPRSYIRMFFRPEARGQGASLAPTPTPSKSSDLTNDSSSILAFSWHLSFISSNVFL